MNREAGAMDIIHSNYTHLDDILVQNGYAAIQGAAVQIFYGLKLSITDSRFVNNSISLNSGNVFMIDTVDVLEIKGSNFFNNTGAYLGSVNP